MLIKLSTKLNSCTFVFNLVFSSFYNNHLTADVKQCITKAVEGKGRTGLPLCEINIQVRLWRWWACQWPTPYLNGPKKIWRLCWRLSQSPWLLRPWRGSRWLTSLTGSDRFYSLERQKTQQIIRLKSRQRNQRGKSRWDWYWNYTLHKQTNPGKERTAHKGPEKKCLEEGRSERGGQAEGLELGGRDQVSAFSWLWSWLCAVALCLISFQALASDWRRCWSWIALAVMDV